MHLFLPFPFSMLLNKSKIYLVHSSSASLPSQVAIIKTALYPPSSRGDGRRRRLGMLMKSQQKTRGRTTYFVNYGNVRL